MSYWRVVWCGRSCSSNWHLKEKALCFSYPVSVVLRVGPELLCAAYTPAHRGAAGELVGTFHQKGWGGGVWSEYPEPLV